MVWYDILSLFLTILGLDDANRDSWLKSFDVNVVGFSNMVQAVEPFMHKGGDSVPYMNLRLE